MRRAVRQQSMAVLPPPSTSTRLPIAVVCSKATLDNQSMPRRCSPRASSRPGRFRPLPRGAPVPTNTASYFFSSTSFRLSTWVLKCVFTPMLEDVVHFLVQHRQRQAERRYLAAHHAAAGELVVVDVDAVTQRREVAGHGERGRTSADQRNTLAVFRLGTFGMRSVISILVVGGDALEAADRHRLLLHPAAPTGGFAGSVAGAPENARKHVGVPVDHVGVGVALRGDQADVLRHRRVRRTGVLAVDYLVEILGIVDVGGFQGLFTVIVVGFIRRRNTCRSTAISHSS